MITSCLFSNNGKVIEALELLQTTSPRQGAIVEFRLHTGSIISHIGSRTLCDLLSAHRVSIERVYLCCSTLQGELPVRLYETLFIQTSSNLREIHLHQVVFNDDDVPALRQYFSTTKVLEKLHIDSSDPDINSIPGLFENPDCTIQELSLMGFHCENVTNFMQFLSQCKHLRVVHFRLEVILISEMKRVVEEGLMQCDSLEKVKLKSTRIPAKAVRALLENHRNKNITHLSILGCGLTEADIVEISSAVKYSSSIESLSLHLTEKAFSNIWACGSLSSKLHQLRVHCNESIAINSIDSRDVQIESGT
eukprot:TRINITY_DN390_c0_g1_i11.p1 TRINITY_DN390_c0_g1~~TRINITY_DN390_c0_g1_i11.p1  ORF type:complete len:307 (-),score=60.41 TRINITY_DN390_c0_g1_i11:1242-2162(-)